MRLGLLGTGGIRSFEGGVMMMMGRVSMVGEEVEDDEEEESSSAHFSPEMTEPLETLGRLAFLVLKMASVCSFEYPNVITSPVGADPSSEEEEELTEEIDSLE